MAEAATYQPEGPKPQENLGGNPFEGKVGTEAGIKTAVDQLQAQLSRVRDLAEMSEGWGYRPLGSYDQKRVVGRRRVQDAEAYAFGGETVLAEEWVPADEADDLVAKSEKKNGNGSRIVFEVVKKEDSDEEETVTTSAGIFKRVVQKEVVAGILPNILKAAAKVDGGPEGECRDAIVRELRERRDAFARDAEKPVDNELAGEAEDIRTRIEVLKEELNPYDGRYAAAFGLEKVIDPDTGREVEKPLGSRRDRAKLRVGQVFGLKNPTRKTKWGEPLVGPDATRQETSATELSARRKHSAKGDAGVLTPMFGGKQAFEFTQPFTNAIKHRVIRGRNKRLSEVKGYVTEDYHDQAGLMAHYLTIAIGKTRPESETSPVTDALSEGSEGWDPVAAQELVSGFVRSDTFRDAVGDLGGDPQEQADEDEEQEPTEDESEQDQQQAHETDEPEQDGQQPEADGTENDEAEEEEEPDPEVDDFVNQAVDWETDGITHERTKAKGEWSWLISEPRKNIRHVIDDVRNIRQEAADRGKDLTDWEIYLKYQNALQTAMIGGDEDTIAEAKKSLNIVEAFMDGKPNKTNDKLPF